MIVFLKQVSILKHLFPSNNLVDLSREV
jgi:hypothetical protein